MTTKSPFINAKSNKNKSVGLLGNSIELRNGTNEIEVWNGDVLIGKVYPYTTEHSVLDMEKAPYFSLCESGHAHTKKVVGTIVLCSTCGKELGKVIPAGN